MSIFGWSYPPGCNGPPDDGGDPHPASEQICEILTDAEVDQAVIDQVTSIVDGLAADLNQECPVCLEAAARAELQADAELSELERKDAKHVHIDEPLPPTLPCPRLELNWVPIDELAVKESEVWMYEKAGVPVPRNDWLCEYLMVLPLQSGDIRQVDGCLEFPVLITSTRCARNGLSPVVNGVVEVPWRDGKHIQWDAKALGGHLPMFAVCGEVFTKLEPEQSR